MREYVTSGAINVRSEASALRGNEPLPEPFESAARMVYGDAAYNAAFISQHDLPVSSLHRWRQRPEMIARVRFLATNRRRRVQTSRDSDSLSAA